MSYADAVTRIAELQTLVAQSTAAPAAAPAAAAPASFPAVLAQAATPALPTAATPLAAAEQEVGVAEVPPGSNDGARIADYRAAVAGATPGAPWCAYFVSWAAAQAGRPLGDAGEGFGSVAALTEWAGRTGRLLPAGAAAQPGDLILFGDRHVGIVESVGPDGTLTTVEGNYQQQVSRVTRAAGEATGFVRLG